MAKQVKSLSALNALEALGANIKMARVKRRISIEDFAGRIGVSKRTVIRLEKGDGGVSIGALAMACLVLGELDLISEFLDPSNDDTGLMLDRENLPKRIDRKRNKKPAATEQDQVATQTDNDDDGVAF